MFYIRSVRTSLSSHSIQVVRYENRKTIIVKHIGSAKTKEDVFLLMSKAQKYIQEITKQIGLFDILNSKQTGKILQIDKCEYLGFRYSFVYKIINEVFRLFGFDKLQNKTLLDLVLIRIIEPSSKFHSLELLDEFFGIKYEITDVYRQIKSFAFLKDIVEKTTIEFAKKNLGFDFSIVFYDVTTLYFEAFEEDDLRKCGFSKDNKFNQPQIIIGLIVENDGFPVAIEVFEGNKFEGHTLLPSIINFKTKHKIQSLTVVADAAMISAENVKSLVKNNLNYIVGARLSNLKSALQKKIAKKLKKLDGGMTRIETESGFLICDFSIKRYRKDRYEMEKQIKKAKILLQNPSKISKRNKFLKTVDKSKTEINKELIEKTKILLGIKGYYTNLYKSKNKTIVKQYHNLWWVEKSFRMAKSDLKMRPIYHHKAETIKTHILICFMALAVGKFVELKTKISLAKLIKLFKSITEARILDKVTNEEIILQSKVSNEIKKLLNAIGLSY